MLINFCGECIGKVLLKCEVEGGDEDGVIFFGWLISVENVLCTKSPLMYIYIYK